jgi:nucleoid-associated protein YgaU
MPTLDELKAKYASALTVIKEQNVVLQNIHVQDNKLFLKGNAPSEEIRNNVWNAIKAVDAKFADLSCEIGIDSSIPLPALKYTVKPGDSLSKIAKEFYGDMKLYPKIFEANRDQLSDPDMIKVGQVLVIPPK